MLNVGNEAPYAYDNSGVDAEYYNQKTSKADILRLTVPGSYQMR